MQQLGRAAGAAAYVVGKATHAAGEAKNAAVAHTPGPVKEIVKDATKPAMDKAKEMKREFKAQVKKWLKLKVSAHTEKLIQRVPKFIKNQMDDPDMPDLARRFQNYAIDKAWPDVRQEIMWEVAVRLDGKKPSSKDTSGDPPRCGLCAFLRYHIYPYDKGFWGRLRDPVWLLVTVGSCFPVSGVYAIFYFLLFWVIDKGDTYQLLEFILNFKGTQFFSHGIVRVVMGYFMFLHCVTVPAEVAEHDCETGGPGNFGSFEATLAGWVLQVIMVWAAFCAMRKATDKGRSELKGTIAHATSGIERQGGYIKYLVLFDAVCFLICVGCLVLVVVLRPGGVKAYDDWPVKHALFATQIVYGFLSLPFFLFQIPVLASLLSHAKSTGYTRQGVCVPFRGPPKKSLAENDANNGCNSENRTPTSPETPDEENALEDEEINNLYDKVKGIFTGAIGRSGTAASTTE